MSGQEKRKMHKGEKAKTTKIQRIRKRVHCTIDPENHEYLENNGINASRLLDKAIYEIRELKTSPLVLICENTAEKCCERDPNPRLPDYESGALTS